MTMKTVDRNALHVVGMTIQTRPLSPEIPALWPKFVARIGEIQGQPLFERYDEAFDPGNPASGVDIFVPVRR